MNGFASGIYAPVEQAIIRQVSLGFAMPMFLTCWLRDGGYMWAGGFSFILQPGLKLHDAGRSAALSP